ncbi:MAG TPA: zinc-dependent metalloprotease [Actinomycetota bacterium]
MADVIDWSIARRVAGVVAGPGPETSPQLRGRVRSDFRELTAVSDELVRSFTGLAPDEPAPEPVVLDRDGWVRANLDSFASLVGPLADRLAESIKPGRIGRRVTAGAVGVQLGVLLGYLSKKVLGQYDLVLATEAGGRVYYVGPNVVEAERRLHLKPADFRLWIALHEITHRTQFAGVPWLREKVRSLIMRSVDSMELDPERLRRVLQRGKDLLLGGPRAWRTADVMTMLMSDEQRELVGEMQALMTVVEGHGTFVMNRLGRERIPTFERMHQAVENRRHGVGGAERAFQRVIGMEMKLEQYSLGERFMNEVADRAGMDTLNKIWDREENLPTLQDLRDTDAWLARIGG